MNQELIKTWVTDQTELEFAIANKKQRSKRARLPKPSKPLTTKAIERQYFKELKKMTDDLKLFTEDLLLNRLEFILEEAKSNRPVADSAYIRADDYVDDIEASVENIKIKFGDKYTDEEIAIIAEKYAGRTEAFNAAELNKNFFKVLGINPITSDPFLRVESKLFTKANVSLIKSIPESYFTQIEGIVSRGAQKGVLLKDLKKEIQKKFKVTENRAKLIARDQVSKFNGQLTKIRQQKAGVKEYEWVTAGDERVRATHENNDGKTFSWDEPPATGHPGEDINCRCVAIPIFE